MSDVPNCGRCKDFYKNNNFFNIGNGLAYVVIYFALVNDKPMKNTAI